MGGKPTNPSHLKKQSFSPIHSCSFLFDLGVSWDRRTNEAEISGERGKGLGLKQGRGTNCSQVFFSTSNTENLIVNLNFVVFPLIFLVIQM